ncbi:phage tail tube protein [Desulfosporosinus sp. PR]|uniref:phage tail tube protein n=1 Tax=Candidatus Desulfosporosinus nitrosoreducens TaxID=3401928 RepID=UPI0027E7680D|nr:phage tail tube protein [Desulfosporosinus sp. PR]MDQ7096937.1 phage tail tube protein [Desulfosporosinus sp. PR]
MAKIRGNNQISGSWGQIWWDGELIFELESFEAKVTAEREDVVIGMNKDSKLVGLKGEGSIKVKKVFSRGKKNLLEAWKKGQDPRSTLVGKIKDPDTVGNQSERISIGNVWFDELTLMQFESGKKGEEEYKFGFTAEDADFLDTIEVQ